MRCVRVESFVRKYGMDEEMNERGSQWLHLDLIRDVMKNARRFYSSVRYAYTTIPTYPCGQIGFILAIKESEDDVSKVNHPIPEDMIPQLRYYSKSIHEASFILPSFARNALCIE